MDLDTSFIGLATARTAFNAPEIFSERPLNDFPSAPSKTLFLASDILLIILVKNSDIGVKSALACSKSPINSFHVCAQPD